LIIFIIIFLINLRLRTLLIAVADILIMLYPLFLSGNIQLHAPKELSMKLDRFQAVIKDVRESGSETSITPYFRFDQDSAGQLIPEDVRLMMEPRRKPTDVIGAQMQITINKGPNGAVPYMYAVILAKREGSSFSRLKTMQWKLRYGSGDEKVMIRETGEEENFSYLVIRQPTEGGGYSMNATECVELSRLVMHGLEQLG
jgi:hypothetical protein